MKLNFYMIKVEITTYIHHHYQQQGTTSETLDIGVVFNTGTLFLI